MPSTVLTTGVAAALVVAITGVGSMASAAAAYPDVSTVVTSFDGTGIQVNLVPATGLTMGETAPTVIEGPPLLLPADTTGTEGNFDPLGLLGDAALLAAGYNVITYNPRGFGDSGGQFYSGSPLYDGRDISAIIDWLATQPEAELKGPNYPVVGMTGVSYGGSIQLSAAIDDPRIAAIVPVIPWNSLTDAEDPNGVVKSGWDSLECGIAPTESAVEGLFGGTNGVQTGERMSPGVEDACTSEEAGALTPADVAFLNESSPGAAVGTITAPTFLVSGTVDTAFPLEQAVTSYNLLKQAGTPVKMMFFCGGHGLCTLNSGPSGFVEAQELNWLNKYLMGSDVSTGPGFEYLDQNGVWMGAPSYPLPAAGSITATGSGFLGLSPSDTSGLLGIIATPASNGLDVPIPAPSVSSEIVGAPTVTFTYAGLANDPNTAVFAQIVDKANGTVVDNQATAIRVTLDGAAHTVTMPMNMIVWNATQTSQLELQITDSSDLFLAQGSIGLMAFSNVSLSLPTVSPGSIVPTSSTSS